MKFLYDALEKINIRQVCTEIIEFFKKLFHLICNCILFVSIIVGACTVGLGGSFIGAVIYGTALASINVGLISAIVYGAILYMVYLHTRNVKK